MVKNSYMTFLTLRSTHLMSDIVYIRYEHVCDVSGDQIFN